MVEATTTTTIESVAGTADNIVKEIAKVEPMIAAGAQFIPGAGPFIAIAQPWIPAILSAADRALADIAAGNNGDLFQAFLDLLNHMTAGRTAAPALAPEATSKPSVVQASAAAAASTTSQAINFQAPTG